MQRSSCTKILITVVLAVFAASAAFAGDEQTWTFEIEPYLLGANIQGDSSIGGLSDVPIDIDFRKILETLDAGGMLHFEMRHRSGWGLWLDYGLMDLKQDRSGPADILVAGGGVRQVVFEACAQYRRRLGGGTIDYFGGVRWWDNDYHFTITVPNLDPVRWSRSEDWIDPVIGVRWIHPLGEHWDIRLRGDIAGFGVGSDFSSALSIGTFWTISRVVQLDFTFKALWVDYETGSRGDSDYFTYDTVTFGPILGVNFRF